MIHTRRNEEPETTPSTKEKTNETKIQIPPAFKQAPVYTSENPPSSPPVICVRFCTSCLYSCASQLWRRSILGFHSPVWEMARAADGSSAVVCWPRCCLPASQQASWAAVEGGLVAVVVVVEEAVAWW